MYNNCKTNINKIILIFIYICYNSKMYEVVIYM